MDRYPHRDEEDRIHTIQITIDEPLLGEVDLAIRNLHTTRSEFIRDALRMALRRHRIAILEQQHEQGYATHPQSEEVEEWAGEQCWETK